jgi:hypothetical protein
MQYLDSPIYLEVYIILFKLKGNIKRALSNITIIMPQLDCMAFFSQFVWFSVGFIFLYAFILENTMCSLFINLKFRQKKMNFLSNKIKNLTRNNIFNLPCMYDFCITRSTVSSVLFSGIFYLGSKWIAVSIQNFNNVNFCLAYKSLVSSYLNFILKHK